MLNSASTMILTFKLQIFFVRGFGRVKAAYANSFAVGHQLRAPFSLVRRNTQKTGFISLSWLSYVLQISKSRNIPQIVKSVVALVSVFVVNMPNGKTASYVQPSQSVRENFFVVNCYRYVAGVSRTAGFFANKIWAARMLNPHKASRSGRIMQNRSDMVSGYHEYDITIKGEA